MPGIGGSPGFQIRPGTEAGAQLASLQRRQLVSQTGTGNQSVALAASHLNGTLIATIGTSVASGTAPQVGTITDTDGNAWRRVIQCYDTIDHLHSAEMWVCEHALLTGSANTVTIATPNAGATLYVAVMEYVGSTGFTVLDTANSSVQNNVGGFGFVGTSAPCHFQNGIALTVCFPHTAGGSLSTNPALTSTNTSEIVNISSNAFHVAESNPTSATEVNAGATWQGITTGSVVSLGAVFTSAEPGVALVQQASGTSANGPVTAAFGAPNNTINLLVAEIAIQLSGTINIIFGPAPNGLKSVTDSNGNPWKQAYSFLDSSNYQRIVEVWYCDQVGSSTSLNTVTGNVAVKGGVGGTNTEVSMSVQEFSGLSGADLFETAGFIDDVIGTTADPVTADVCSSGDLLISVSMTTATSAQSTPAPGWRPLQTSGTPVAAYLPASGTSGVKDCQWSYSPNPTAGLAVIVAFRRFGIPKVSTQLYQRQSGYFSDYTGTINTVTYPVATTQPFLVALLLNFNPYTTPKTGSGTPVLSVTDNLSQTWKFVDGFVPPQGLPVGGGQFSNPGFALAWIQNSAAGVTTLTINGSTKPSEIFGVLLEYANPPVATLRGGHLGAAGLPFPVPAFSFTFPSTAQTLQPGDLVFVGGSSDFITSYIPSPGWRMLFNGAMPNQMYLQGFYGAPNAIPALTETISPSNNASGGIMVALTSSSTLAWGYPFTASSTTTGTFGSRALAFILAVVSTTSASFQHAVAHAVSVVSTTSASLVRNTTKTPLVSVVTTTANLVRQTAHAIAASASTSAALTRNALKRGLIAGVFETPTFTRSANKVVAGTSATSAALSRAAAHTISASVTSSAALARNVGKILQAVVAVTASFGSRQIAKGISVPVVSSSGAFVRNTAKAMAFSSVVTSAALAAGRGLFRTLSASVTTSAALTRNVGKNIAGLVSTVASLSRNAGKGFGTFVITSAALARNAGKNVAGTVTTSGALSRSVGKALAALTSTSAALARAVGKTVAGTAATLARFTRNVAPTTPLIGGVVTSASLVRNTAKSLGSGTVATSAALARGAGKALSASVSTSAAFARQTGKGLLATAATSAGFARAIAHGFSAGFATTASWARAVAHGFSASVVTTALISTGGRLTVVVLSATVNTSAALSRQVGKIVPATVATVASFSRAIVHALTSAGVSTTATLSRAAGKTVSGSVATSAALARAIAKSLASVTSTSAQVSRAVAKTLASTASTAASLTKNLTHPLSTGVSTGAALARGVGKQVVATVALTPTLVRNVLKFPSVVVATTPTLQKSAGKALTVLVSVSGILARQFVKVLAAVVTTSASLARNVNKILSQAVTTAASLIAGHGHAVSLIGSVVLTPTVSKAVGKAVTGVVTAVGTIGRAIGKVVSTGVGVIGTLLERGSNQGVGLTDFQTVGNAYGDWTMSASAPSWSAAPGPVGWLMQGVKPVQVISSTSTEYVKVKVNGQKNGQQINPTADGVQMAFMSNEQTAPAPGNYNTASWETQVTGSTTTYVARCLVGPGAGGVVLTQGIYEIWVKVTDNPEIPTKPAGELQITP